MLPLTELIEKVVLSGSNWMERSVRGAERALTPREVSKIRTAAVPEWVEETEVSSIYKTKEQPPFVSFSVQPVGSGRRDHFVSVGDGSDSVAVSPNDPFRTVEFAVFDTIYTDHLVVEAIFETTDGDEIHKTRTLTDGSFFAARYVPIRFTIDEPAQRVCITVESNTTPPRRREQLFKQIHRPEWKKSPEPGLTVPTPRGQGGTPILLISVDTFRHDYLHTFEPVLSELGEAAVVPAEPRTQGYATQPSHGSLFTGVHPTTHGNFATKNAEAGISAGIDPELDTITKLLARNQYKCSGCGSEAKIGPKNGFGDGMDRFRYYPISWDDRIFDGSDIANAAIDWIRTDSGAPSDRLFYFLHFFDPHYPYIPPQPEEIDGGIDYELADRVRDAVSQREYIDILEADPVEFPAGDTETLLKNYEASLQYTAFQVQRVIKQLKHTGLFDNSLIIITGDHGEEFFERNFWGHNTLYDNNIRPGMIIKPPADTTLPVRDAVDLIDVFPTIAELVEGTVPEGCQGVPLQDSRSDPRITERHGAVHYSVAVEQDGVKGIFTYEYEFPGRPTEEQVTDGLVNAEFYRLAAVRSGSYEEVSDSIDQDLRADIQSVAESFILQTESADYEMSSSVSRDVEARLEQLGYK